MTAQHQEFLLSTSTFNHSDQNLSSKNSNQDSLASRSDDFSFVRLFKFLLSSAITSSIVVFGVWLQANVLGKNEDRPEVDKETCDCTCWDARYKGSYGSSGYKSVYFNFDETMILIAFWLFFAVSLLRNVVNRILELLIVDLHLAVRGKATNLKFFGIRSDMIKRHGNSVTVERLSYVILFIFVVSAYSNFYGAWVLFNYFNDRDHRMLKSQIFYVVTEFLPSYIYLLCVAKPVTLTRTRPRRTNDDNGGGDVEEGKQFACDLSYSHDSDAEYHVADSSSFFSVSHVPVQYIYPVFTIALVHMLLALPEGMFNTQISEHNVGLRDIGLMATDFLGVLFSMAVVLAARRNGRSGWKRGQRSYLKLWTGAGIFLWMFYRVFCVFD